jgi:hypothetical protein
MVTMVIYEDFTSFIMTDQHQHGLLSEGFARNWNENNFLGLEKKESVLYAIAQHDRAWIDIDESPIWNDKSGAPYSFHDYPIPIKLQFYRKGIDEIEDQNQYAALLCSVHYTNFFMGMAEDHHISRYLEDEKKRQTRLFDILNIKQTDMEMDFHYQLLKFCDNLSLFVCMQEAGALDYEVHEWFKNGIKQPFEFFPEKNFQVKWSSRHEIIINPFPFNDDFEISVPIRKVPKNLISKYGIEDAYHKTPIHFRTVKIKEN